MASEMSAMIRTSVKVDRWWVMTVPAAKHHSQHTPRGPSLSRLRADRPNIGNEGPHDQRNGHRLVRILRVEVQEGRIQGIQNGYERGRSVVETQGLGQCSNAENQRDMEEYQQQQ